MIKLGMIGGGVNSAVGAAHVAALRMTGRFELVAGCFSHDPDESVSSAIKYGARSDSRIEDLLTRDIDRVVILSPTPLHFEHVNLCLAAKIPVLCEKALGVNATETATIVVNSQRMDTPVSCVFNYFFYDAVQKMRALIEEGELGSITHIRAEMPQAGYLISRPQSWRMTDSGIYLDLMTHLLHLIWELSKEEPSQVWANERKYSDQGVVDYVSAFVEYETFTADLFVSKCSAGNTNGLRLRVYGTEGSIEWLQLRPDQLLCGRSDSPGLMLRVEVPNKLFKLGHPSAGFVGALANLYDAWAVDAACAWLSPSVAHSGLSAIAAMRESACIGKRVCL